MNIFTRLAAGIITAFIALIALFFLATAGIFIAAIVGVALFAGALSMRGKKSETQVGSFRVITFGSQPFGSQASGEEQREAGATGRQKHLKDVVDLSPEDYRSVETSDDKKKAE